MIRKLWCDTFWYLSRSLVAIFFLLSTHHKWIGCHIPTAPKLRSRSICLSEVCWGPCSKSWFWRKCLGHSQGHRLCRLSLFRLHAAKQASELSNFWWQVFWKRRIRNADSMKCRTYQKHCASTLVGIWSYLWHRSSFQFCPFSIVMSWTASCIWYICKKKGCVKDLSDGIVSKYRRQT